MLRRLGLSTLVWIVSAGISIGQQVPTTDYQPKLLRPSYVAGSGPVVGVDESHHNFHTRDGRYGPFARLLEADGFQVIRSQNSFEGGIPDSIELLVIANPLHASNTNQWELPNPSAFTQKEMETIETWVRNGGSLFLIADHMPFPGAANELAKRFGIEMANGFAFATDQEGQVLRGPILFQKETGGLGVHPIIDGRTYDERISQVASFTGHAFRIANHENCWVGLLALPDGTVSLEPQVAWQFDDDTKRRDVAGWFQGAVARVGRGRIAVFGEAAMFTSQQTGASGRTIGFGAETAIDNQQLLLNISHWLTATSDPVAPGYFNWPNDGAMCVSGCQCDQGAPSTQHCFRFLPVFRHPCNIASESRLNRAAISNCQFWGSGRRKMGRHRFRN